MNQDYRQLLLDDDVALARGALKTAVPLQTVADRHNDERRRRPFRRAVVLSDGSRPGAIAAAAVSSLSGKFYRDGASALDSSRDGGEAPSGPFRDTAFLLFADATTIGDGAPRWLHLAEDLLAASSKGRHNRCIVVLAVPEPRNLPAGVARLAEREYDAWLERESGDDSPARTFAMDAQRLCRAWVRDHGAPATLLRCVNVVGPGCATAAQRGLEALLAPALASNEVSIGDGDAALVRSYTASSESVMAAGWALWNTQPGHEYNIVSFEASAADLKRALFNRFPGRLSLQERRSPSGEPERRCLDTLKALGGKWDKARFSPESVLADVVAKCACFSWNERFSYAGNIAVYNGRLPQIKAAEMRVLREIDRICEKHGIPYFLAGGSMLGAIRYGHSIPWDDDFDIGFLRRDFDRFRKACDRELGPGFVHSCYYNGTRSHYVVDKIRLRGTYFSTNYSSIHAGEDGVFIDMLVYDATFRNRHLRFVHDKLSALLGYILQIYWMELKRAECRTAFTWGLYKAIRLLPIGFWHRLFEAVISVRRHCRLPDAVIDSTGKCIGSGAIPFPGLEGVRRVPFDDGFQAPVPVDPTNYLTYDYGPRYIQEPPYCMQVAPHNFARIDLGAFLFRPEGDAAFRDVDPRGELYEPEAGSNERAAR